jgi:hypothetical protein
MGTTSLRVGRGLGPGGGPYRRAAARVEAAAGGGGRGAADAEASFMLGVLLLGSAPRAATALWRHETFGVEATLCSAVVVASAALLCRGLWRRCSGACGGGGGP